MEAMLLEHLRGRFMFTSGNIINHPCAHRHAVQLAHVCHQPGTGSAEVMHQGQSVNQHDSWPMFMSTSTCYCCSSA